MIWLTNKWAQIGVAVVAFMAWLSIRDSRIAKSVKEKMKGADNERANYVRRRVDAIERVSDDDIKFRD